MLSTIDGFHCKVDVTNPFTSEAYTLSAWAGLRTELSLPIAISTNHVSMRCTLYRVVKGIMKNTLEANAISSRWNHIIRSKISYIERIMNVNAIIIEANYSVIKVTVINSR